METDVGLSSHLASLQKEGEEMSKMNPAVCDEGLSQVTVWGNRISHNRGDIYYRIS